MARRTTVLGLSLLVAAVLACCGGREPAEVPQAAEAGVSAAPPADTTAAPAQDTTSEGRARRVSVAALDSSFAAMPFEEWLTTLRDLPPSALVWEVNDCGEGGDGLEAPTCVEAILQLAPDTTAHASLMVAGLDGTPGEPAVWMLYAFVRDSIVDFESLGAWAAFVRGE